VTWAGLRRQAGGRAAVAMQGRQLNMAWQWRTRAKGSARAEGRGGKGDERP